MNEEFVEFFALRCIHFCDTVGEKWNVDRDFCFIQSQNMVLFDLEYNL